MKDIVNKLVDNGYEAYIVGGYVRDYLLGVESLDVDISTNAPIKKIQELFKGEGTAYPQYYAYHMEKDGVGYDITSYRKELKYRRNKPIELEPAKDLAEDLLRRDFTVNTFAITHDGKFIDIYGAKKDLDNKLIRVVGDINDKFKDDKTRIIRAIRFACTLDFDLEPRIIEFLSSKCVHYLNEVPIEFKKKELDKIFDSSNAYKFFYLLKRYNLFKYFNIQSVPNVTQTYNRYGIWAQMDVDLPFSKEEKMIINSIRMFVDQGDISISDFPYHSEEVIFNVASILGIESKVKSLLDILSLKSIIDIDMGINDMLEYVDVNDFKHVYKSVERNIMEGNLENRREAIIDYLRCL